MLFNYTLLTYEYWWILLDRLVKWFNIDMIFMLFATKLSFWNVHFCASQKLSLTLFLYWTLSFYSHWGILCQFSKLIVLLNFMYSGSMKLDNKNKNMYKGLFTAILLYLCPLFSCWTVFYNTWLITWDNVQCR